MDKKLLSCLRSTYGGIIYSLTARSSLKLLDVISFLLYASLQKINIILIYMCRMKKQAVHHEQQEDN